VFGKFRYDAEEGEAAYGKWSQDVYNTTVRNGVGKQLLLEFIRKEVKRFVEQQEEVKEPHQQQQQQQSCLLYHLRKEFENQPDVLLAEIYHLYFACIGFVLSLAPGIRHLILKWDALWPELCKVVAALDANPSPSWQVWHTLQYLSRHSHSLTLLFFSKDLNSSEYLHCFTKEVFRFTEGAPVANGRLRKAIKIKDEVVPAGSITCALLTGANRNAHEWKNHLTFDPSRWISNPTKDVYSFSRFGSTLHLEKKKNSSTTSVVIVVKTTTGENTIVWEE